MGSRRVCSGGRKGHCVVKHVRHHITSLGFCLLPGGRTSPSSSKPTTCSSRSTKHCLCSGGPNTISIPQRISTPAGPGRLVPRQVGESTEKHSESGAFPAPQPVLAPAPGILGVRIKDPWVLELRILGATMAQLLWNRITSVQAPLLCCRPLLLPHTQPRIAQLKRSCARLPDFQISLTRAPRGNEILG